MGLGLNIPVELTGPNGTGRVQAILTGYQTVIRNNKLGEAETIVLAICILRRSGQFVGRQLQDLTFVHDVGVKD